MSSPRNVTPDVVDVVADRAAMELRLTFADGTAGSIGLVDLRMNCPCAGCRARRQEGLAVWPVSPGDQTLELTGAQFVGAWGLGVAWNDGHATGIYPFDSLHEWVVAGHPVFHPDSGLGS